MKLLGREHIHRFRGHDERMDRWLLCWEAEIIAANWKSPKDILAQFPNAVERPTNRFFFAITPIPLKVEIMINFPNQIAVALPASPDIA
jgi:mRNA-degrading endonuclease HigB of HigAB toxin-antitoxin module